MGRETKVGLLAGLTFIVCFAIILSNRGRREPTVSHMPYRVDGGVDVHRAAGAGASRPIAVLPPPTQYQDSLPDQPPTASVMHRPTPTRVDRNTVTDAMSGVPTSGAEVALLTETASSPATPPPEQSAEPVSQRAVLQPPADGTEFDPSRPVPAITDGGRPPSTGTPATSASRAPSLAQPRRYTVVPGDTLSKIASAHYGRRSAAVINAIYEANRSALSSPDLLPVGAELALPALEGFSLTPGSTSAAERPTTMPLRTGPFRWYQIKKNDRYVSIAREQLGDASRWREVYELNKDRFPDPDRIRDGVLIRVPGSTMIAQGTRP